jgi:hypothetical protein
MSLSKLFSLFAVATVLVAAPGAQADSSANQCFLSYRPSHVRPYEVERSADYERHVVDKVLAGAHVFIPAEPGLTAEWLRSQLDRRAAETSKASECPLDVEGVRVSVQSGGPGFWVTIATDKQESAQEVLRRAQHAAG